MAAFEKHLAITAAALGLFAACANSDQGVGPGGFDGGLGGFGQDADVDASADAAPEASAGAAGAAGSAGSAGAGGADAQADVAVDAPVDAYPDAPPDVISQPGLSAYYTFEETGGPVFDVSGNNNHGTVKGTAVARAVAGKIGFALGFNGGNGQVQIPSSTSLDFSAGASIELWIKLASVQTGTVLSRGTGQNDSHVRLKTAQGNIQASFGQAGSGAAVVTSDPNVLEPGKWAHVAVVDDGSNLLLYVNGNLHKSAVGGYLTSIFADLYIGKSAAADTAFNGSIDDLKWWSVVRSAQDVCGDAGGTWALVDGAGACSLP